MDFYDQVPGVLGIARLDAVRHLSRLPVHQASRTITPQKTSAAAYHSILVSERCSCNALKAQGISELPRPPACICRYVPNGSSPLSTDLRLANPRGNLRIRRQGTVPGTEYPALDHSKLDSLWPARCDCWPVPTIAAGRKVLETRWFLLG